MAMDNTAEVMVPGACAVLESESAGENSRSDEGGGGTEVGGAKMRLTSKCRGSMRKDRCSETEDLEQDADRSSSDNDGKDVEMSYSVLAEPSSCSAAKTLRKEVLIRAATFNELDSKTLLVARELSAREEVHPVKKLSRTNTMPEICYQCLISADRSVPTPSTSVTATTSTEGRQGGRDSPLTRRSDVKKFGAVKTLRKDALIRAATFSSLDTKTLLVAKEKGSGEDTTAHPVKTLVRNNTMPEICYHCLLAADITVSASSSSAPETPSTSCSTYVEEACGNMNHNAFLLSQSMVTQPSVTLSMAATPTPPPRRRSWAIWREPYDHFDMRCFVNAFLLLVFGLVPWVVALITLLQDGNHVLAAGVAVSLLLLACILVLQIAKRRRRATSDPESQRQEVHGQQYLEAPPDYELLMAKPPPYEVLYEVRHCPTAASTSASGPSSSSPRLLHLYRPFKPEGRSPAVKDLASGEAIDDDDDDLPSYEFAMRYCNLLAPPTSSGD